MKFKIEKSFNFLKDCGQCRIIESNSEKSVTFEFPDSFADDFLEKILYKIEINLNLLVQTIEKEKVMKAKKATPFNKYEVKNAKKAFDKTEKTVKPVAKDTNKTRRKMVKPTKRGM